MVQPSLLIIWSPCDVINKNDVYCLWKAVVPCQRILTSILKGGGGGYQNGPISAYNQVPFFCLMSSPICLLYRVI